jgi:hypothetical protein
MASAEELDDAALNVLRALRVAPHLHAPIIARAEELLKPAVQPNQPDRATVERQLQRLEKVYLSGDTAITDGLYIAERARLRRIMNEAPPPPPMVVDLQKAVATLSNMGELLDQSDSGKRRGVLLTVFSALWVEPGNIKAITPTGRFQLLVEAMASVNMCGGCPTGFEPATS